MTHPETKTQGQDQPFSKSEKLNFRNSLFEEIRSILEGLEGGKVITSRIRNPVWISKTDEQKARLLGAADYASLSAFCKKIDKANAIREDDSIEAQLDLVVDGTSRRAIIDDAKRIFTEIAWLRSRKGEVQLLLDSLQIGLMAL